MKTFNWEKSDLNDRSGRIAYGTAFDESYYREICVPKTHAWVVKNYNIRGSLN